MAYFDDDYANMVLRARTSDVGPRSREGKLVRPLDARYWWLICWVLGVRCWMSCFKISRFNRCWPDAYGGGVSASMGKSNVRIFPMSELCGYCRSLKGAVKTR